jgi:Ni/Fe-hydrogenase 1 B-type cytochrome subunit
MILRRAMRAIIVVVMIRIRGAVRGGIMSRQSRVSTSISGHRTFKERGPD